MTLTTYFQIDITPEQVEYAKKLVDYSLVNHKVRNIWSDTAHEKRTLELRLTGTLGEVVFADTYRKQRPTRSFGAADGQDFGCDFMLETRSGIKSFDIKTMRRISNVFYDNYILNIPRSQLFRADSLTDYYFHISLHTEKNGKQIATFVGYVAKSDVTNGMIGSLFECGAKRTRANGTCFNFTADTYEILLKDFTPPPVGNSIRNLVGYQELKIRTKS